MCVCVLRDVADRLKNLYTFFFSCSENLEQLLRASVELPFECVETSEPSCLTSDGACPFEDAGGKTWR